MFLIENNLPFCLISAFIELIKAIATDSEIVKELRCARTKATETTLNVLNKESLNNISSVIQNQAFSIIIDETTDISSCKCLVVVCRYFDYAIGKVRDRFLTLLELKNSDSLSIYEAIKNFLLENKIKVQNMVGYAADNASVMMGRINGVKALFQRENPNLYVIGCICHSLNLCSSAAAKKLPKQVENLVRNIYQFFAHSSKRQNEFKELQEYFGGKNHKILKIASTRWLSLEQVVNRTLEQWNKLEYYFISFSYEDRNSDQAQNILSELNIHNKIYLTFLSYILNLVNKMNIEFQAETPRIHVLLPNIKSLVFSILSNFLKKEFITSELISANNIYNKEYFLNTKDIYIGARSQILINSSNLSEQEIIKIKETCLNYYKELCSEILNRIDINDKVLSALECINPLNLGNSIVPLVLLFPNLINEDKVEELDHEWRTILNLTCVPRTLNLEDFWCQIFNLKNGLSEPMFPNIKKFVGGVLSFPHSSATAERIFSELKIIKNEKRNCLKVETINGIMSAKAILYRNTASSWIPSEDLIQKYHK